jgi:hypothetical protein
MPTRYQVAIGQLAQLVTNPVESAPENSCGLSSDGVSSGRWVGSAIGQRLLVRLEIKPKFFELDVRGPCEAPGFVRVPS